MGNMYDTIIVGAGPAGSAAALYCARAGWRTLVIDRGPTTGSTAALKNVVDYPGVSDKISGEAFVKRMRWQARDAGADFREATIDSAALAKSGRMLFSKEGKKFEGRTVIIASGCALPKPTIEGEDTYFGNGVSYGSWHSAGWYRKKAVAVYGKCVEAAEAALALSNTAATVHFIIPSTKLDLPESLDQRLQKSKRIACMYSASVKAISGQDKVEHITVLHDGKEEQLDTTGIMLFHHAGAPELEYLSGTLDVGEHGGLMVDNTLETSIPGVFACGEVLCASRQSQVISVAQGVMAAGSVTAHLRKQKK